MRTGWHAVFMPNPVVCENDRVPKRGQPIGETSFERRRTLGSRDGRRASQNLGTVALDHPDLRLARAGWRPYDDRLHLFALEGGVAAMRR